MDKNNKNLSFKEEILLIRNFLHDYNQAPKDFFDLKHAKLLEQIRLIEIEPSLDWDGKK